MYSLIQDIEIIKGESQVHVLKVVLGICMYFKNRMYFCTVLLYFLNFQLVLMYFFHFVLSTAQISRGA